MKQKVVFSCCKKWVLVWSESCV